MPTVPGVYVLIVGPTGAGKTTALEVLRRRGWAVFDEDATTPGLISGQPTLHERAAIALDPGRDGPIATVPRELHALRHAGHDVRILALDADDTTLLLRLARQGRQPPLSDYGMEDIGFSMERERIAPLVAGSTLRVQTSSLTPSQLGEVVARFVDAPRLAADPSSTPP